MMAVYLYIQSQHAYAYVEADQKLAKRMFSASDRRQEPSVVMQMSMVVILPAYIL